MNTLVSRTAILAVAAASLSLVGCASNKAASSDSAAMKENAVIHHVTEEDRILAASKDPITADSAVLWVNGLGCPQCATNIDLQLERVVGVKSTNVDLSNGKVTVGLGGNNRPSPARLGKAVHDAGFTLVKIETK